MLRDYQRRAIDDLRRSYTSGHRAPCLVLPTGGGKCLGIGTPVLMFDGHIVAVEDVRADDALMGPDGEPRRVLSIARGTGPLYRINPARGQPWTCNDVHVLTLVHTETGRIVDIDLKSYMSETKHFRHLHKQFAPENGIDFADAAELPLDPYFLGIWYGDGTKSLNGVSISKPDHEILASCVDIAHRFGLRVRTDGDNCPTHHLVTGMNGGASNPLLDLLRSIVGNGLRLPHRYLTSSRSNRLAFLAGLLDTDGYLHHSGFEIVQKQRGFADGIGFLARSLGMRAIISEKLVNGDSYWRVSISGDCSVIPTRIPRKKAPERKQIKCATRTGFSVEEIGQGEYAGFELDGDGRFLLGDFTVTHNTVIASEIIRSAVARGRRVLFLAHRDELIAQSVVKLEMAGLTDLRIISRGESLGNPLASVSVASVQTLTRWSAERMPAAEFVVFDECHHIAAKTWRGISDHYKDSHLMGMTATPQRADGSPLGDVFDDLVIGSTVAELTTLGHLVPCSVWSPPADVEIASGSLALSPVEAYKRHCTDERAVIFCATVEHADQCAAEMTEAGMPCETVHGQLRPDVRKDRLSRLASGALRAVTNVHVLTEGWDLPAVSVCILARRPQHAGTYLQMVGRVLRPSPGKSLAIILDLGGTSNLHGPPEMERHYTLDGNGIEKVKRDLIRQCPTCGAVFLWRAGIVDCPTCHVALPRRMTETPRSIGVGLVHSTGGSAPDQLMMNLRAVARRKRMPDGWVTRAYAAIGGVR